MDFIYSSYDYFEAMQLYRQDCNLKLNRHRDFDQDILDVILNLHRGVTIDNYWTPGL
jgi:hypothetical protein